jgi:D-arabinono-1,4-lactone oxidase
VGAHFAGSFGVFEHPQSEEELIALVKRAYREGRQLRVRGAAHSPAHAVYTDPPPGFSNQVDQQKPPAGTGINVMLDRYRSWRVKDEQRKLVEVDAGIHLGVDPSDPTHTSTRENSLLYQLTEKGWMLSDTGGISHQTVSGFTGTGSSGGSFAHSVGQNLWGFRVIDGRGEIHEVSVEDDPDEFYAHAPHLGLLGVVSKLVFRCVDAFEIVGEQATSVPAQCAIDVFGPGDGTRLSLADFLRQTEFARVEWWPQRGCERVLVWQAASRQPTPGFEPHPFQEFTDHPEAAEFGISVLYAVLSNLADLSRARRLLRPSYQQLSDTLAGLARDNGLGSPGALAARAAALGAGGIVDLLTFALTPCAERLQRSLPTVFGKLLSIFIPLDGEGGPQRFRDWAWHGLPMDDQANDVLVSESFMEAWFPVRHTERVVSGLRDYLNAPPDAPTAFARTGINAWELYGAGPSGFWLSPSYTTGNDEWADGAIRIDAYWYQGSPDDPTETFYPQFWRLFRSLGVPFRLHWGKHQPPVEPGDRTWADFFRAQYPRWDDFLALREQRDPGNIFLTRYWRDRFGLWDRPSPTPQP